MTDAGTRIGVTDVRTVAIPVADQERARDFYAGTLGFETRMDVPLGGGRWLELAPAGATTAIALVSGAATGVDTGIRFTTTDAAADHQALGAAGVEVDELLRYPGVPPMFSFRDPDGNRLYIVEAAGTA
jgi:catechol 2,3-dioxygenase-like lactoylglutathione lyase family enzyme